MTKEEYIQLVSEEWDSLSSLQAEDSFYSYEKGFDAIWVNLGKKVLERSISSPTEDRRKKKTTKSLR